MDKYTKLSLSKLKNIKYKAKLVLFIAERDGLLFNTDRPDREEWEKKIGGIIRVYRDRRFVTRAQLLCLAIAFDEDKELREAAGLQPLEDRWQLYIAAKRRLVG